MAKIAVVLLLAICGLINAKTYEATWDSLDKRPLPTWYDDSKFGIFMHWGVFSVPSFGSEWFWWYWKGQKIPSYIDFMKDNYPPEFQYADFAPQFTAEFFDPDEWADLFKASGARYVVLTSKHHEGFTNWPSVNSWNWNSVDVGPRRDLVGDLAAAVRNRTSIHFGLYHSFFEWFNPLYLKDKENGFKTQDFVSTKTMPELYDLINRYKPELIWSDGQWEASSEYWNSTEFLAWLYNSSPVKDTVVVNDRWGKLTPCKHGGYYTCTDRYNPGILQPHKWENAMTIDKESWGYRRNAPLSNYLTIEELLQTFVTTISCGGNLLANIGPTKAGTISPIFEERLRQMGEWLGVNGEAVYGSKPWKHQNDTLNPNVWYTTNNDKVYAFVLSWSPVVQLASPLPMASSSTIDLIGGDSGLVWADLKPSGVAVELPWSKTLKWVWVLRLTGFQ